MLYWDKLGQGKSGRGQTDGRKEGELVKNGEDVVVDVWAAVETEQSEAPRASSAVARGRGEPTREGSKGVGGDGATTEIESK